MKKETALAVLGAALFTVSNLVLVYTALEILNKLH
jgi:hypothetical protein